MPRSARLNYPGGVFHVVSRFVRDEYVLRGDVERGAYLHQLARALDKTDAAVVSYCLMSNHVHLVLVQGDEPLERLFKPVHTGFALWVHRHAHKGKKARFAQGPVIAARPRTVLVEAESYLLELVRYVHNNPVRAGLVRHAVNSTWSSHQAYVGKAKAPAWLNMGYVLERFGSDTVRARREFEAFVRTGEKEPQRAELSGAPDAEALRRARAVLGDGFRLSDAVLGGQAFAAKVAKQARSARETLGRGRLQVKRGAWEKQRPDLAEVVSGVLKALSLDAVAFTERPQATASQLARQLIVWIWVHHLGGKQIDVVRELAAPTYSVARWYGHAVKAAAELEELSEAVLHGLVQKRPRAGVSPAKVTAKPRFRYQVELE